MLGKAVAFQKSQVVFQPYKITLTASYFPRLLAIIRYIPGMEAPWLEVEPGFELWFLPVLCAVRKDMLL